MELSGPSSQNFSLNKFLCFSPNKSTLKNIRIFQEMELFGSKIKIFLIFSQEKLFLYFEKWNFLALRLKNFKRELSKLKK